MVHSVFYGTESLTYLGPKSWDIIPEALVLCEVVGSGKEELNT